MPARVRSQGATGYAARAVDCAPVVFWSGFGFLVAIIGMGSLVLAELVSESITGNERFYQETPWVPMTGMTLAAILTAGLNRVLLRKEPRILIDPETGERVTVGGSHSLFLIPLRWWPRTFLVVGALLWVGR